MRSGVLVILGLIAAGGLAAQGQDALPANDPGRKAFESRCGRCHGGDGRGGEMGPNIVERLPAFRTDDQLTALIHTGIPQSGMPPNTVEGSELASLVRFLHSITPRTSGRGFVRPRVRMTVETTDGKKLEGLVLGEGFEDLQLRTDDKTIHLLRRAGSKFREVTSAADWPQYNGDPRGNRYTTLAQITRESVNRLAPRWIFAFPAASFRAASPTHLEVTPIVVGGLMYITDANRCIALDAGSGREVWRFVRPRTPKIDTDVNRGVAAAGDKVFMETDNAHIVAINRFTGEQVWDSVIADSAQNYFATSAPLTAGDLVVTGVGGGEQGANGMVVAYEQATGKEVWRFHVIPKRGEPGSETWQGKELDHGGGPTWFTGSYDPDLDTVYWPTGNPSEEYNGDARPGDNLYSDCILALDRKTGKLKWYYQFTPHDLWDWDATETSVLVDAPWQGQTRKLMLHADRNGFYYVFDRTDGKLLLAKQFLKNVTWASGIGAGRPSGEAPQPGANGSRHPRVPITERSHQLVFAFVQSAHRPVLFPDQREVQHLYQEQPAGVGCRPDVSRRFRARRAGSQTAAYPEGHRLPDRRHPVGDPATGARPFVGRHPLHRHGPCLLRGGNGIVCCRGQRYG